MEQPNTTWTIRSLPRPLNWVVMAIDALSSSTGWLAAWLILPMMFALVYEVTARYFFRAPTIWAYDVTYMLYGTLFMLGAAHTLRREGHIRTDFVYRMFPARWQGFIDAALYLCLFFPALALFLWVTWDYAATSWTLRERMMTSPWLPHIYPFKTVLPATAALLLLQGISQFIKSVFITLRGHWYEP